MNNILVLAFHPLIIPIHPLEDEWVKIDPHLSPFICYTLNCSYCRLSLIEYMEDASKMMKNYAKVTVYNERLSVTRVQEVEAYSLLQLFSDIGNKQSFTPTPQPSP